MLWEAGRLVMILGSCSLLGRLTYTVARSFGHRPLADMGIAAGGGQLAGVVLGNMVYCWGWAVIGQHWETDHFTEGVGLRLLNVAILSLLVIACSAMGSVLL